MLQWNIAPWNHNTVSFLVFLHNMGLCDNVDICRQKWYPILCAIYQLALFDC